LGVVEKLRALWVQIDEIDLPVLDAGIAVYYTLMPAELSTNLSRFDGIRFGHQWNTMEAKDIYDYFAKVRSEWFGEEAKRRILLWTFVLSSANYEWYYLKALKIREKMVQDLDNVFQKYDLILSPTTPEVAWKIWEKVDDPLKMYLADMYTVPANLAGLPAISIPVWTIEDKWENMPVWLHLMANKWKEDDLFVVGREVENIMKN
jgi:aspartyl-tRNA(Asn)/glutamyl-tRNA(Gln) amidotransferase subunit A